MKFKKQRSFIVNSSSARLCEPTPKADRIAELRAKLDKAKPSNVGQSQPVSKQIVFDKLVKVCDANGIDMLELAEMIIDHSTAPTVTEVAA